MTDEAGAPVQVNIDLRRHGAELAAFLRAHGLIAGGFGAELPAERSGTVCDELSGTLGGERLTGRYVPSADRRLTPVVYRSQVRPQLHRAVDKALVSLHRRRGTSAPTAEEYAAVLLTALERHLHGARLRQKPAPEGYERYGRDMFGLRFRIQPSPDTLWIVCYTLHHGTVVVRYIGTEAGAAKK